jgi:hypothetical protein
MPSSFYSSPPFPPLISLLSPLSPSPHLSPPPPPSLLTAVKEATSKGYSLAGFYHTSNWQEYFEEVSTALYLTFLLPLSLTLLTCRPLSSSPSLSSSLCILLFLSFPPSLSQIIQEQVLLMDGRRPISFMEGATHTHTHSDMHTLTQTANTHKYRLHTQAHTNYDRKTQMHAPSCTILFHTLSHTIQSSTTCHLLQRV